MHRIMTFRIHLIDKLIQWLLQNKTLKTSLHRGIIDTDDYINGTSPVWIIIWWLKLASLLNPLPQTSHLKTRSGSWTSKWVLKLVLLSVAYGHLLQTYLKGGKIDLWCHTLCLYKVDLVENHFEQIEHALFPAIKK